MQFFIVPLSVLALALGSIYAQAAEPNLKLPAVIGDHMVLQAGKAVALWGWSDPGTTIKAEFLDEQGKVRAAADATTSADGRWALKLPSLPAAASGALRFTAGTTIKTVQDVVVGEVWLGGGQSNMTYTLGSGNIPKDMDAISRQEATAAKGAIRFFRVGQKSAVSPQEDVQGNWFIVTADNYKGCSAVAWNFAVALREKIPSPIGIIVSAVGGTSATQWMPKPVLDACPAGPGIEKAMLQRATEATKRIKKAAAADAAWLRSNPTPELRKQNSKSRPQPARSAPMFSEFYNGMIHGLEPYTMKGILWFQADGDMGIAFAYGDLIKAMIKAWRAGWQEELPFYYVEMNNMRGFPPKDPAQGNDALSVIRQQQEAALELPQTDVACSIDVGLLEPEPHFPNKKPVGQRLALLAFNNVYGMPCAAHSPAYESFTVDGDKIRLHFKYADGLRVRGGGEVIGFQIRGASGNWVWAKGKVDGHDTLVWNDQIPHPTEVKYGWSMNPLISMENSAGLPMHPFSTVRIKP